MLILFFVDVDAIVVGAAVVGVAVVFWCFGYYVVRGIVSAVFICCSVFLLFCFCSVVVIVWLFGARGEKV